MFLAALAGPGLIAPDLANNALPLYFSRPLTRGLRLGAADGLIGMLSMITWVPGLLLFGMQVGMAGGGGSGQTGRSVRALSPASLWVLW